MTSTEQVLLIKQLRCCSATLANKVANQLTSGNQNAECEFKRLALLTKYINVIACHESPLVETEYILVDNPVEEDTIPPTLTAVTTTTEYNNCLTEDQIDQLAANAQKICDICN